MTDPKHTWNHRVVRRDYQNGPETTTVYEIYEVYYTDDKPDSITMEPIAACSESLEGLRETLERMLRALDKPVLNYEDF